MSSMKLFIALLLLFAFVVASESFGQQRGSRLPPGRTIEIDHVKVFIPDVEVVTNRGQRVRLYSDLIKHKVVLLSFFYTSCSYICPMQGQSLARVQDELGPELSKKVFFLSISMDPMRDTEQKLKEWGRSFGAGPDWTIVSSDNSEVARMIEQFTGDSVGPRELHSSMVFLGNDRTGEWLVSDGLFGPGGLIPLLKKLTHEN
jgi:protein SCO1